MAFYDTYYTKYRLLGVIAMFSAILILLSMPFTDLCKYIGLLFNSLLEFIVKYRIEFIVILVIPSIIFYLGITLLFYLHMPICVQYYTNRKIIDNYVYMIYFINEHRIKSYIFKFVFYIYIYIGLILTAPLFLLIIKHDPGLLNSLATHILDIINLILDALKPQPVLLMGNTNSTT